ncbi:MAG: hypothetical protein IJF02_04170 [Oscillospiraceae bacterium]|nr:hypothetical protein [Oscillospiraceae bacterium]
MRKKKSSILPRPVRAVVFLFLALLLALTVYVGLGSPPMNAEMVFRRAERAHMVGPSKILGEFSNGEPYPRRVIIAETDDSHILYTVQRQPLGYRRFYTNPKPGEIDNYTFHAYPKTEQAALYNVSMSNSPVQLVLFDRQPDAVRAEMEAELTFLHQDEVCTMDIQTESVRTYDRFFLFSISKPQGSSEQWYRAMDQLISRTSDSKPEVTIRLYDAQGNLMATECFTPGQNGCWQRR